MSDLIELTTYLQERLYTPHDFTISELQPEQQNSAYAAGRYLINETSIRVRAAKITPKKVGQFVAFWQKDEKGINQPYALSEALELLVIYATRDENQGLFVFPRELLATKKILTVGASKGKMAMRVYPPWDQASNAQGKKTQAWQVPYFIDLSEPSQIIAEQLKSSHRL